MVRQLGTVDEVIDALGGTGAVAVLTGKSPQAVSNWRSTGRIPPEVYLVIENALGVEPLPELFGIRKP